MNLALVEATNRHPRKNNKWVLKLIGIAKSDLAVEDLLELISHDVQPTAIEALLYDSFNCFYTLFLNNIESFCQLIGKKASFGSFTIRFLPLIDLYVVDNVFPSTTNDDLCITFKNFGDVFEVTNYHILPNSSKFSHILSGKREISFILPGEETELAIPVNVFHPPYRYNVSRLCSACMTEGHSVLNCPDREDEVKSEESNEDTSDSTDSDINSILKNEYSMKINEMLAIKQENMKDDDMSDRDDGSTNVSSLKKKALVPFNNEIPMPALSTSEFQAEPYDEMPQLSHVPMPVISSSEFQAEPYDELPHLSNGISKTLETCDMSEGTPAVPCSSSSSFFSKALVKTQANGKRKANLMLENENSIDTAENPSDGIKRNNLYPEIPSDMTSDCDNLLPTVAAENSDRTSFLKKPRKVLWQLTPEAEKCIDATFGVLPPHILKEVLQYDFRKQKLVLDFIYRQTTNFNRVFRQFKRLHRRVKHTRLSRSNSQMLLLKITKMLRMLQRALLSQS